MKITLKRAERADRRQPRDGLRRHPVGRIRRCDAEGGHAREGRPGADRHRPVLSSSQYQKDAVIRYKAFDALLGRQGEDRRSRLRDHARSRPPATPSSRPANATSCRIRTRPTSRRCGKDPDRQPSRAGRPQHRLPRRSTSPRSPSTTCACARPSTWRSTSDAILKDVYQGAGQKAKNPIPPTIWSYNDAIKDYPYDPEKAKELLKEAGVESLQTRSVVDAGAAALQPERQAHGGDDAGRPRQGRHQRRAQDLRVGRVPQAPAGGRAPDGPARLDRRQRRSRTTSSSCSAAPAPAKAARTSPSGATRSSRTCCIKAKHALRQRAERTSVYKKMQVIFKEEAPVVDHRPLDGASSRSARK